mgnify:CR=1 FL=1
MSLVRRSRQRGSPRPAPARLQRSPCRSAPARWPAAARPCGGCLQHIAQDHQYGHRRDDRYADLEIQHRVGDDARIAAAGDKAQHRLTQQEGKRQNKKPPDKIDLQRHADALPMRLRRPAPRFWLLKVATLMPSAPPGIKYISAMRRAASGP